MDNINILVKNYMNINKQFIIVISCFDYGFIRNYELDFAQFFNCKVITYHSFKTVNTRDYKKICNDSYINWNKLTKYVNSHKDKPLLILLPYLNLNKMKFRIDLNIRIGIDVKYLETKNITNNDISTIAKYCSSKNSKVYHYVFNINDYMDIEDVLEEEIQQKIKLYLQSKITLDTYNRMANNLNTLKEIAFKDTFFNIKETVYNTSDNDSDQEINIEDLINNYS